MCCYVLVAINAQLPQLDSFKVLSRVLQTLQKVSG